jgi:hypothetical protein
MESAAELMSFPTGNLSLFSEATRFLTMSDPGRSAVVSGSENVTIQHQNASDTPAKTG